MFRVSFLREMRGEPWMETYEARFVLNAILGRPCVFQISFTFVHNSMRPRVSLCGYENDDAELSQ